MSCDELFNQALKTARIKDLERDHAYSTGKVDDLPYLHGIPCSIKDHVDLKDARTTLGCSFLH